MLQRQHRRWRHDKTKSVSPPGVRNCQDFLYVYLSTVKCRSSLQQVLNTMKASGVRFFVLLRHPQSHPHYRWLFTENIHYFITLREYDFFVGMAGGWQEKLDGEYAPVRHHHCRQIGYLISTMEEYHTRVTRHLPMLLPFSFATKICPKPRKNILKFVKINAKNCYCHFICHV